jgi:hypothetical protein
MKVFISWSGEASNQLALALADWIPKVLQGVEPFVSSKDIDKGAAWVTTLAEELKDTDFGIICLTEENLSSPWLHYEAGAIYKSVASRICPVLLGIDKDKVQSPLDQLQCTDLKLDEITRLMLSMNKAAGSPVDNAQIEETVDVWWSKLDEKIKAIALPSAAKPRIEGKEPKKPEPELEEMIEEVLRRLRNLEHSVDSTRSREARRTRDYDARIGPTATAIVAQELVSIGLTVLEIRRLPAGGVMVDVADVEWPLQPTIERHLSRLALNTGVRIRINSGQVSFMVQESGEITLSKATPKAATSLE